MRTMRVFLSTDKCNDADELNQFLHARFQFKNRLKTPTFREGLFSASREGVGCVRVGFLLRVIALSHVPNLDSSRQKRWVCC